MANQRLVNTNFWKDTYVIDLDPIQKLLFLYFLTNPRTSLAGVYEISLREVAFDTGIDKDMVEKILAKFCSDEKMYYEKGWVILRNFVKHQRLNPSIKKGIENAISELPAWLREIVENFSSFYDQQRLELVDKYSLGTDSPQSATKEAKRKEENIKESKEKESKPGKLADFDKKSYAKAVRADENLARRAEHAAERVPSGTKSGYEIAKEAAARLKKNKAEGVK